MKNWLGAAGRLCADFLLVLLIIVAVAALGKSPAEATIGDMAAIATEAGFRLFPLAAVGAIFLGSFAFERRTKRRFVAWTSALILGFGLLVGGSILRRLDIGPAIRLDRPRAEAGKIAEGRDLALYMGRIEGGSATKVFGAQYRSGKAPSLTYAPRADFDVVRNLVALGGKSYPALPGATPPPPVLPQLPGLKGRQLDDRLMTMDKLPLPSLLIVLGGFALLTSGFSGLSRLPRWPLVGFFFALGGVLLILVLDSALVSPAVTDILAGFLARIRFPALPPYLVVAAIEAFLGLALGLVFFFSKKEYEE